MTNPLKSWLYLTSFGLIIIATVGWSKSTAAAQAQQEDFFHLKNNTSTTLTCSLINAQNDSWFELQPGQGIEPFWMSDDLLVLCQKPVDRKIYKLKLGQRYSILRSGGTIKVKRIRVR